MDKKIEPRLYEVFYKFSPKENRIFRSIDLNNDNYNQNEIVGRETQCQIIFQVIKKGIEGQFSSNLLCYGRSGTGKTFVMKHILNLFSTNFDKMGLKVPITSLIDCRIINTGYRIFAKLCSTIGLYIPLGLSLEQIYHQFRGEFDKERRFMVIILDEFERLFERNKKQVNTLLYILCF